MASGTEADRTPSWARCVLPLWVQGGVDVSLRLRAACGCSWFPGVHQAPAHGCDQEGGEDDTQRQGADV